MNLGQVMLNLEKILTVWVDCYPYFLGLFFLLWTPPHVLYIFISRTFPKNSCTQKENGSSNSQALCWKCICKPPRNSFNKLWSWVPWCGFWCLKCIHKPPTNSFNKLWSWVPWYVFWCWHFFPFEAKRRNPPRRASLFFQPKQKRTCIY